MKEPSEVTPLKLKEVIERLGKWSSSPEGRAAIQEALRVAKERNEHLKKARAVTFEQLHTPYEAYLECENKLKTMGEGDEADKLRDLMDALWMMLTTSERKQLNERA